ncbi:MAG: hypothetical protein L0G92_10690, partial [Corynebacterium casei]|nr:hypothetical protein [Corynebacterium casei]
ATRRACPSAWSMSISYVDHATANAEQHEANTPEANLSRRSTPARYEMPHDLSARHSPFYA